MINRLFLAAALVLALNAQANNILSDPFNYPDGDIVLAPGSVWSMHSGAGGANAANVSNGVLRLFSGNTADVNALLTGGPYYSNSAAVLYSSFKLTCTNTLPTALGTYFAHFKDTNAGAATGFGGRVWVSITNAVSGGTLTGGKFRIGIGNGTSAASASGQIDQDLFQAATYTIVTRFVPNTGVATIWLNPTLETDPSVTATDPGTPARPNAIDVVAYAFRQNGGEGTLLIDDLRVGTTFDDVTGANLPPTISSIGTLNIPANGSAGPLALTVGDAETPAASLVLSRTSSNPTLLPTNNIVFGGSGSNRTVTITPASNQEGSSSVALTVTDGLGSSATTTFTVIVGAPTISDIANQNTPTNVPLTGIAFTVTDVETPNSLTVTATSSNTTLLPNAGIGILGSGASRTLSLTSAVNQAGITLITVTVSDGTQSASDTFLLTVFPQLGLLINEPFPYADGTHIADGGTAWINHSGTFGQTLVNGGKVSMNQTNDEDFNREFFPLSFAPGSGVILYASYTVNFSQPPNSAGSYFAHYKDDGTVNFRGRIFASAQGAASGKFRLGVANTSASISANGLYPTFLDTNVTYTVVTRYNVGTDETTLWVNPTSEASPSVTATDPATPITVLSFALRQSGGIGIFTFDDLKIGTKYTDVATEIPSYSLRIFRSGDNAMVAWPVAATGFTLQSHTNWNTTNWQDVATTPTVVGSEKVVTNTLPGTRYFRLRN